MNERDRQNLDFLMSASPDVLRDWYNSVSEDDVNYASELLRLASEELDRKALIAAAHDCLALNDETIDCSEAKAVIAKFMLKGQNGTATSN